MNILRLISYLILGFSIWFFPWWLSAILLAISIFYFKMYFEGVILALVYDSIFSISTSYFGNFQFIATLFAILLLFFFQALKSRLFWTQGL